MTTKIGASGRFAAALAALALTAFAQQYPQQYPPGQYPPQSMAPQQLDGLVQRIALYPDPLLAQVLTAATYWDQIPPAAAWANQHSYLRGQQLAQAIRDDALPWDPSVLALLPFPQVLNTMAGDPGWTQSLGTAVLNSRPAVMDAVQRMRQEAMDYGYLQSNQYEQVVVAPGAIQILPVNPQVIYVPHYSPGVVFVRRRPAFAGAVIRFGPGITLGAAFVPFGWEHPYLGWREHTIVINNRPWMRTWNNREHYEHPYEGWRRPEGPRVEHHEERGRERGHHEDHDRHDH